MCREGSIPRLLDIHWIERAISEANKRRVAGSVSTLLQLAEPAVADWQLARTKLAQPVGHDTGGRLFQGTPGCDLRLLFQSFASGLNQQRWL
jgi:hypothetical protein